MAELFIKYNNVKKIKLLLPLLCLALFPHAQQPSTGSQQAVQQSVLKIFDALSNRDSAGLKMYCTNDVAFYEYGQAWNLDTLISKAIRLNTAPDFRRINTINFINTAIRGKVAWTTYNNRADITMNGKQITIKWLETVVLVKEQGRWKINVLHSSLIK